MYLDGTTCDLCPDKHDCPEYVDYDIDVIQMKSKILSKHLEFAMKLANQSVWKSYKEFRHLYIGQGSGRMVFTDGTYAYKVAKTNLGLEQNHREIEFHQILKDWGETFPISKILSKIEEYNFSLKTKYPKVIISDYIKGNVYQSK